MVLTSQALEQSGQNYGFRTEVYYLSSVPKKGERRARCIFDARPANKVLERCPGTLEMFSLADLLDAWEPTMKVTVIDYRPRYEMFQ